MPEDSTFCLKSHFVVGGAMPPYGDFCSFEALLQRRLFALSVLYYFLRVVANLGSLTFFSGKP